MVGIILYVYSVGSVMMLLCRCGDKVDILFVAGGTTRGGDGYCFRWPQNRIGSVHGSHEDRWLLALMAVTPSESHLRED